MCLIKVLCVVVSLCVLMCTGTVKIFFILYFGDTLKRFGQHIYYIDGCNLISAYKSRSIVIAEKIVVDLSFSSTSKVLFSKVLKLKMNYFL